MQKFRFNFQEKKKPAIKLYNRAIISDLTVRYQSQY